MAHSQQFVWGYVRSMLCPKIFAESLVLRDGKPFAHGNRWQYHSRSDHHSQVACWGLMLDLLLHCNTLRAHASQGLVGFGINHKMRDFRTGREKTLDLVICRPRTEPDGVRRRRLTFAQRGERIGVAMTEELRSAMAQLPTVREMPVGTVQLAVEAKATMTAHTKALPRLYDELTSSHETVHGASEHTIAVGLCIVNMSSQFISPTMNKFSLAARPPVVNQHNQPGDGLAVIDKLREIKRRTREGEAGFDALGVIGVDLRNDGSPARVFEDLPLPQPGDIYHYEQMVHRLAHLYEQKFARI